MWSFLFIDISLKQTPSNFLCIWGPTFSASSQLMLLPFKTVSPVERDYNASILGLKGLWVLNHNMIFSIDFISCCWWLDANLTCCSLVVRFMFVRVVTVSWIPALLCILPIHTSLIESVIQPPLVMLPLVFREHIITCSIMRSVQRPAQFQSLCRTVW